MADLTFTLTRTGENTTVTCNTCGEATTGADTGALITYLTDDHTCDTLDEPIPNPQPQTRIANPTDPDDRTDDATALPGTTITRRRPIGRTPDWTDPRLLNRIVDSVAGGCYMAAAAAAAGIHESTLYRWLAEAQNDDAPEPLREFRERITRARGLAEETAVSFLWEVSRGGHLIKRSTRNDSSGDGYVVEESFTPPDAKPVMFLLERSFPQRWSRRSTLDVGINPDSGLASGASGDDDARLDALAARTSAALAVLRGVVVSESESA
ncbi:MAG: hypothetical protein ACOH10_12920 [Rhodoglobus sp.]